MASIHGRPTAAELVEAVREFLSDHVMGATSGQIQFHTRVAINVLGTVQRELTEGSASSERYAEGLAELGVHDDAELAVAIRTGQLDDRMSDVIAIVREATVARLLVANPRHLAGSDSDRMSD